MNDVFNLAIRMSFSAPGLAVAVGLAASKFRELQTAATRASTAVDRTALTLQRAQGRTATALGNMTAAQARLTQAQRDTLAAQTALTNYVPRGPGPGQHGQLQQNLASAQAAEASALSNLTTMRQRHADTLARETLVRDANTAALSRANVAAREEMAGQTAMAKMAAGGLLMTGGMMGLGVLGSGLQGALQLQQSLTLLGKITAPGRDPRYRNVGQLQDLFETVATQTQFSVTDIAQQALEAATGGINQRDVLATLVPEMANLAEVGLAGRGISPQQSIASATTIAHLFQQYPKNAKQAESFKQILNLVGQAQFVSNLTPDQMARALTYVAPARTLMGTDTLSQAQGLIGLVTLGANVGLTSGRGGTSRIMRMIQQIAPSLGPHGLHNRALAKLAQLGHGQFFDPSGTFLGLPNLLDVMSRALYDPKTGKKRLGDRQMLQLTQTAFGTAGAAAVALLATPESMKRNKDILTQFRSGASLDDIKNALNATTLGQWRTLKTSLGSISVNLATALLPSLNGLLHILVLVTNQIMIFTQQHKFLTQLIAVLLAVGSAVMVVVGAFMMLTGALAVLSMALGVEVGVSIAAMVVALGPFLIIAAAVTAAITALVLIMTHWKDILNFFGAGVHSPDYKDPKKVKTQYIQAGGSTLEVQAVATGKGKHRKTEERVVGVMPGPMLGFPIGGGAYGPGMPHVQVVVNGADHRTTEQLAHHVATKVGEHLSGTLRYGASGAGVGVSDLDPSLHGI
jgi:TP901 family phage tail tape measure protein